MRLLAQSLWSLSWQINCSEFSSIVSKNKKNHGPGTHKRQIEHNRRFFPRICLFFLCTQLIQDMAPKLRQSATPLPHDGESPVTVVLPGAQPYGFDFRKNHIFVFLWVFRPIHRGVRYFTDDGTLTSFVAREIPNRFRLFQGVKVLQEPAVSL